TLYHYRVRSRDASGNLSISGDLTFTTAPAPDTTAPTLTNIASTSVTTTGARVSWVTNEPADTQVEFGTTTSYGSTTTLDRTLSTNHAATLSGLTGGTTYHYRVRSRDAAGNLAVSADRTF